MCGRPVCLLPNGIWDLWNWHNRQINVDKWQDGNVWWERVPCARSDSENHRKYIRFWLNVVVCVGLFGFSGLHGVLNEMQCLLTVVRQILVECGMPATLEEEANYSVFRISITTHHTYTQRNMQRSAHRFDQTTVNEMEFCGMCLHLFAFANRYIRTSHTYTRLFRQKKVFIVNNKHFKSALSAHCSWDLWVCLCTLTEVLYICRKKCAFRRNTPARGWIEVSSQLFLHFCAHSNK